VATNAPSRHDTDAKKPPEGGFQIPKLRSRGARFLNYFDAAEAAVTAAVAAAIAPVAAEAAAAVEDAASATEEAASATDEAAEAAASAAGAAVSAGLLQAARAATATREANRSDLFMNFLEEKLGSNHYR
jgi:hypothetical protein